ncbi:S1 family peptidase [Microbacterium arborescens]|uniref:S1 family peptidase n=1 Tax=Microbacterium arborescens TaxID=33883 RepID=UPI00278B04CF|nr:S1 family peptidase [Microbacterium arborescens]MDQ1217951.1 hypothetical protein [Microbacterium arborescens]
MKLYRGLAATTIAGCVIALSIGGTGAASAAGETEPELPSYLAPVEPADLPPELRTDAPDIRYQTEETVPLSVSEGLLRLELENPEIGIAGAEWDAESKTTFLYATAPEETVAALLAEYGIDEGVEYRAAQHDAATMRGIIREVIGGDTGRLESGHAVVSATPALDGSRIDLVLEESSQQLRAAPALPDIGIPLSFDYGPRAVPTMRNHEPSPPSVQRFSGAHMHGGGWSCTTGFRVTRNSNPGMVSADHCSLPGPVGTQWYYNTTSNHFIGQAQGQIMPSGPGYRPDLASWTGGGTGPLVPGIFIGTNTVAGSGVYPISGAVSTPVGATVCYSGSPSGTVCGNTVTNVNVTLCYGGDYGCYDNLTITNNAGAPAAGQGDSGGPAYSTSAGVVYAAGIISGILDATTTCTGDSGGRLCSPRVAFAVINDVFVAGYALNIVP